MRLARRIVYGILSLVSVLFLTGFLYQTLATRQDATRSNTGGQFFDVNGKKLHVICKGSQSPTVIIEPGVGSWSTDWIHVQKELSRNTRVCTYDRAGLGWSEQAPKPTTGHDYVRDLHDLMRISGERPPYILVGHSLGGYLTRIYYAHYPDELAGIVMADAAHEDQWDEFPDGINDLMVGAFAQMRAATWMARFGVFRVLGFPDQGLPTDEQQSQIESVMATPSYWQALLQEFEAGLLSLPDEVRTLSDLGDLPVLVITAEKSANICCSSDGSTGVGCIEAQAIWDRLQEDLTKLSINTEQVILANATHAIFIDTPKVMASHITSFVRSVRPHAFTP